MKNYSLVATFSVLVACGQVAEPKAPVAAPADDATSALTAPVQKTTDAGELLVHQGKWAEARTHYDARLKADPEDLNALYYAGLARENLGDWKVAEQLYRRVLTLSPYHPETLTNLAAHSLEAGDFAGTKTLLDAAASKPGAACSVRQNFALALAGLDDARATAARDTALACDPASGMFRVSFAELRAEKHREEAIRTLAQVPSQVPGDAEALRAAGGALRALSAYKECVAVLQAVRGGAAARDAAVVYTELGLCNLGLKDDAAAARNFAKAVETDPTFADAYYYLGGTQARDKQHARAASSYAKFLELAPKDAKSEAAKMRLQMLSRTK